MLNSLPSSHDENPASQQIVILLAIIFVLGLLIVSNTGSTSRDLVSTFPDQEQNMISNPQIDESEAHNNSAVPVVMFNLENPHGIDIPVTVNLVGSFQDELGCETDFEVDCDATQMKYDILGDIWRASFTLPRGTFEYRVHLDKSDSLIYGKNGVHGANIIPIMLTLNKRQTVNFYYDHKTGWITDDINSLILTLPGNFQDKVGCREEWNAQCFRTWMQDLEGDGIYTYETLHIPSGSWETRIALNGEISTSYGQGGTFDGENIPLWIPNIGHLSVFTWDSNLKTLTIFVSNVPIRLSTDLPAIAPNE